MLSRPASCVLLVEAVLAPTCLVTASPAIGHHTFQKWQLCFSAQTELRLACIRQRQDAAYCAEDQGKEETDMPAYKTDHMQQGL